MADSDFEKLNLIFFLWLFLLSVNYHKYLTQYNNFKLRSKNLTLIMTKKYFVVYTDTTNTAN